MPPLGRVVLGVIHRIYERRMRSLCASDQTTRFQLTARVANGRGERAAITIGKHSVIAGNLLVFAEGGQIFIGEYCFVGSSTRIWSSAEVRIGNRVLISHNVNIHDTMSHSLSAGDRHEHFKRMFLSKRLDTEGVPKSPIVIEDDVWIGYNASIMRGVRIGKGAVISSGVMVNKDVPAYTIISGAAGIAVGPAYE